MCTLLWHFNFVEISSLIWIVEAIYNTCDCKHKDFWVFCQKGLFPKHNFKKITYLTVTMNSQRRPQLIFLDLFCSSLYFFTLYPSMQNLLLLYLFEFHYCLLLGTVLTLSIIPSPALGTETNWDFTFCVEKVLFGYFKHVLNVCHSSMIY